MLFANRSQTHINTALGRCSSHAARASRARIALRAIARRGRAFCTTSATRLLAEQSAPGRREVDRRVVRTAGAKQHWCRDRSRGRRRCRQPRGSDRALAQDPLVLWHLWAATERRRRRQRRHCLHIRRWTGRERKGARARRRGPRIPREESPRRAHAADADIQTRVLLPTDIRAPTAAAEEAAASAARALCLV